MQREKDQDIQDTREVRNLQKIQSIQEISKRFSKNILFVQGVSFALIVIAMFFATSYLKIELADQIGRSVEGKIKRGDKREVSNILSDARNHQFIAVDLYDESGQLQLQFPTESKREEGISFLKKLWINMSQSVYKKEIFFDKERTEKMVTVVFRFEHFQLFPFAILIFILGSFISYPFIRRHKNLLLNNLEKEGIQRERKVLEELARQVRHDYKSPLTVIKAVAETSCSLQEDERRTLIMSYQKMMSMLNDLSPQHIQSILKGKKEKDDDALKALTHVYSSLLNVVEENKMKHLNISYLSSSPRQRGKGKESLPMDIHIECSEDDSKAYIPIESVGFQRVLSNLMENAIEAIDIEATETIEAVETEAPEAIKVTENIKTVPRSCLLREIRLHIKVDESNLQIEVKDNGSGIPKKILSRVKEKGFSFGKPKGEGLGLYSSAQKIESWGGTLDVESEEGRGTKVTLKLPKVVKPDWATSWIDLQIEDAKKNEIESIVILDDDESIHHLWEKKLKNRSYGGSIFKFTHANQLIDSLHKFKADSLFLLDYELRGQEETGIDVVKHLEPKHLARCHMVSHSYEDPTLQAQCRDLIIGLFPKTLLLFQ